MPPTTTVEAMQAAIADWQTRRVHAPEYDEPIAEARQLFAEPICVPTDWVAIGSQVSALVALATTVLPTGAKILAPEGEFTSVIFPLLVRRDLRVDFVPLEQLASSIGPDTDMVAVSAVQSADGRVADLDAIAASAEANDTVTLVDATQAAGWLPLDAKRFDFVATGTCKWLLSPRGTAFLAVRPELLERVRPLYAGWYAGEHPWESIYGAPSCRPAPGWLSPLQHLGRCRQVDDRPATLGGSRLGVDRSLDNGPTVARASLICWRADEHIPRRGALVPRVTNVAPDATWGQRRTLHPRFRREVRTLFDSQVPLLTRGVLK